MGVDEVVAVAAVAGVLSCDDELALNLDLFEAEYAKV